MVSKTDRKGTGQDKNDEAKGASAHPQADVPDKANAPEKSETPATSPLTTLILTDIAMSAGSALLARSVASKGAAGRLLARALPTRSPGGLMRAPSLAGSLVGTAIARVATRSVPGAIMVGGGLVAKALYDRRKARRAAKAAAAAPRKPR